ncbi:hypothetical protein WJX73_009064 [Symbiochloris irregularis]|uniref:Uncharacterized protein n=1 Tax=Symbiochloris irregularis TaxID=706552 RepID=A0AAW1NFR5_9CHLO
MRGRSLFDLLQKQPKQGLGQKFRRTSWKDDSFWTLTAAKPSLEGQRGKAWGLLTWKGEQQSQRKQVNGSLKKI